MLQLVGPLASKTGWRQDQRSKRWISMVQLGHQQPGLNRLAQADLVGERDPSGAPRTAKAGSS